MVCLICNRPKHKNRGSHPDIHLCLCRNRPNVNDMPQCGSWKMKEVTLYNCGIEVEAAAWGTMRDAREGNSYTIGATTGRFMHDGSVTSGMEWVSGVMQARPTSHCAGLVNDLLTIADEFEFHGVTYDATCGLHVHVDQRTLSHYELVKCWSNFIHVQDWVYKLCHPSREAVNERRHRTYCNRYPLHLTKLFHNLLRQGTGEVKKWLYDQLYTVSTEAIEDGVKRKKRHDSVRRFNADPPNILGRMGMQPEHLMQLKGYKYTNNRYYGLNLMCWFNQGTIEYRMQGHPLKTEDLVMWPLLCCALTNRLISGPLLTTVPKTVEEFYKWLGLQTELQVYVEDKVRQFANAWQTTTITPTYQELV